MRASAPAWLSGPVLPRVLPFAVYMAFVAVMELGEITGLMPVSSQTLALIYPLKAACTALALVWCLPRCAEFRLAHFLVFKDTALAVVVGLFVFAFWIQLDFSWASLGEPVPFAHDAAKEGAPRIALLACRFMGAALVAPLAEELFWRSWLIRALQDKDFTRVPPGVFTWFAFLAVNALFALEHHLVLAGFLAGAVYTLLLRRTGSVTQCVLAHAVTNAALGLWVMYTGNWTFW